MKRLSRLTLLAAFATFGFAACNNGDYDANPDTNYSGEINPLNPKGGMNTAFDWTGNDPMSMEVNGEAWKADGGSITTAWENDIEYWKIGGIRLTGLGSNLTLTLKKPIAAGNEIDISAGSLSSGLYLRRIDPDMNPVYDVFNSQLASAGRVKILEYDDAHIKGLFYFLGRSNGTFYVNIQKGYFNINK